MRNQLRWTTLLVAVAAAHIQLPVDAHAADERCFLWKAQSDTATVYLLGSLHVGSASLYPMDPAIEAAFETADALVLEVKQSPEMERKAAKMFMERGIYRDGTTLRDALSGDTMRLLETYLGRKGMRFEQVANIKPWFLGLTLAMRTYQELGYEPTWGIDQHFQKKAARQDKEILQLETMEEQMNILSGTNDEVQDISLREGLKQLPKAGTFLKQVIAAWQKGDDVTLDKLMRETMTDDPKLDAFNKALLDDRNVNMVKKIQEFLKTDKTYFVVVGSAHLAGDKGMVRMLRDKKLAVEQIEKKGTP